MSSPFTVPGEDAVEAMHGIMSFAQSAVNECSKPGTAQHSETILLVDDERHVRDVASRILELYGYNVLVAKDAQEGIRIFDQYKGAIDLLVTDVVMPGMTGPDLALHLVQRCPGLKGILISGYSNAQLAAQTPILNFVYLQKPFSLDALARKVREVIDGVDYPIENTRIN